MYGSNATSAIITNSGNSFFISFIVFEIIFSSFKASLPRSSFLFASMTGNIAMVLIPEDITDSTSFKILSMPYLLMFGIDSIGSEPFRFSFTKTG